MAKEKRIVNAGRKVLVEAGAFVEKNHGSRFGNSGRPDLTGCFQGLYFGIETKVPGEKATPLQEYVIGLIHQAGGYAGVLDNVEDFRRIIRAWPFVCKQCLGELDSLEGLNGTLLKCRKCGTRWQ